MRLEYFCARYNNHGLGSVIGQVIQGEFSVDRLHQAVASYNKGTHSGKMLQLINEIAQPVEKQRIKTNDCQ